MSDVILYGDSQENFYKRLEEFIQTTIRRELAAAKKEDEETGYLKKIEVCGILKISKPTVDSHVKNGYYKKYRIGGRVFYNRQEILGFLKGSNKRRFKSLLPLFPE